MKKKILVVCLMLVCSIGLFAQLGKASDYRAAAEKGEAWAQFNLGVCYLNGEGVTQDYKQAVYWWTKAANQGYVTAQFNLGICYYKGNGVTQDYKQAVYWFTKAANQGYANAQYNLGLCYYYGDGTDTNYYNAQLMFNKYISNWKEGEDEVQRWYSADTLRNVCYFKLALDYLIKKDDCKNAQLWKSKIDTSKLNYFEKLALERLSFWDSCDNKSYTETTTQSQEEDNSSSSYRTNTATSSSSSSYSSYSDRKYRRWPYSTFYEDPTVGVSLAWNRRSLFAKHGKEHYRTNVWGEPNHWIDGLNIGLMFYPCFDWGLGLYTGLSFEFYYSQWDEAGDDNYDTYAEYNFYVPLDLMFRIPFNETTAIYLRGGLGLDISAYNELSYSKDSYVESIGDLYGDGTAKRFNASFEFGANIRFSWFMLFATYQKGFTKHPVYSGFSTTEDKLQFGVQFVF